MMKLMLVSCLAVHSALVAEILNMMVLIMIGQEKNDKQQRRYQPFSIYEYSAKTL